MLKLASAALTAWAGLWVVAGAIIALCYARHIAARCFARITSR